MFLKGIELNRKFYQEIAAAILNTTFGEHFAGVSVAFLGPGSEVLGFEDEISTDHNYHPRLTVFLDDTLLQQHKPDIEERLNTCLPQEFQGFKRDPNDYYPWISVRSLPLFFTEYLGVNSWPPEEKEWLFISEQALLELSAATVFHDPTSQLIDKLKTIEFYPDDLHPLIVNRALARLSEVQGLERAARRNDIFAATTLFMNFAHYAVHLAHFLNKRYCPYYKWKFKSLSLLEDHGDRIQNLIIEGIQSSDMSRTRNIVKEIFQLLKSRIIQFFDLEDPVSEPPGRVTLIHLDGIDFLMKSMTDLIPDRLKKCPDYIQPPSYWGQLFDYRGYELSFSKLLKNNQNFFEK